MLNDIMQGLALLEQVPLVGLDKNWQSLGRCGEHPDPDLWFAPIEESSPRYDHLSGDALKRARQKDRDRAREMCRACPVRGECLRYGLESQDGEHGMWGGLDKRDRTRLKDRLAEREVAA